jgi:hypothetical protein
MTATSVGLAFAVVLSEREVYGRAIIASFAGAVLGAVVFDLIGAAVFPLASTVQPMSTTLESRLLARLLVAIATAGIVILFLPEPKARQHVIASAA